MVSGALLVSLEGVRPVGWGMEAASAFVQVDGADTGCTLEGYTGDAAEPSATACVRVPCAALVASRQCLPTVAQGGVYVSQDPVQSPWAGDARREGHPPEAEARRGAGCAQT